jgi:Ca2+-binding EF-hand superfamily protein
VLLDSIALVGRTGDLETKARPETMATIRVQKSTKRPGVNDMAKIRQFFNAHDANNDGVISYEEMSDMLQKMNIQMSGDSEKNFFNQIDIDKSGEVDFGEFLDWYTTLMDLADAEAQKVMTRLEQSTTFTRTELEAIYENYKRVSASVVNDGMIDQEEFKQMMVAGGVPSWNTFLVDGLFGMFDSDGSGQISFEEFVSILATYHNKKKGGQNDKHKLLFKIYDVDKDGKISRADLGKILEDCLKCNNIVLSTEDTMALVEATFKRNGCGDTMDLAAYMKEVQERQIL